MTKPEFLPDNPHDDTIPGTVGVMRYIAWQEGGEAYLKAVVKWLFEPCTALYKKSYLYTHSQIFCTKSLVRIAACFTSKVYSYFTKIYHCILLEVYNSNEVNACVNHANQYQTSSIGLSKNTPIGNSLSNLFAGLVFHSLLLYFLLILYVLLMNVLYSRDLLGVFLKPIGVSQCQQ